MRIYSYYCDSSQILLVGNIMLKKLVLVFLSIIILFSPSPSINIIQNQNTWYFIALGDNRQQLGSWDYNLNKYSHDNTTNPIRKALYESIVQNNPNLDFIVHTGDIVANGGEQDDWNRYKEDIAILDQNNVTIYYAPGNHEYYTYATGPGVYGTPDSNLSTYLANVELPGNEMYYSFDVHNQIHFVFLNNNEYSGSLGMTTDQLDWLKHDLDTNALENIIVVYHRPSYSVRSHSRVLDAQEVRNSLESLFISHGVDLVLAGHDHYYYRTVRNGITHIVTGGGGAELATNDDTSEWLDSDVFYSNYHYCNISVLNDKLVVSAISFNEVTNSTAIIDSFEISFQKTFPSSTTSSSTGISTSLDTSTSLTADLNIMNFGIAIFMLLAIEKRRKRNLK